MIYALADAGARLLRQRDGAVHANVEWARKNREARHPFIAHQTEIVEFRVTMEQAARRRGEVRFLDPDEILAAAPEEIRRARNPFALRAKLSHNGIMREIGVVPDLVFGLMFPDGSRRCFMVEIDRGTMPITRSDFEQTSFERKMRVYLAAHAAGQHRDRFGWRNFRVLAVTTDQERLHSMTEALRQIHIAGSPGATLFLFSTFHTLRGSDPLVQGWEDAFSREIALT